MFNYKLQSDFSFSAQPVQPPHLSFGFGFRVKILYIFRATVPKTKIPINITIISCIDS